MVVIMFIVLLVVLVKFFIFLLVSFSFILKIFLIKIYKIIIGIYFKVDRCGIGLMGIIWLDVCRWDFE